MILDEVVDKVTEYKEVILGTDFEVIPIQKLVKVQMGSALITMQSIK